MEKSWQQDDLSVTVQDSGSTIDVVVVCGRGQHAQTVRLFANRRHNEFWIQDVISEVFHLPGGRGNGLGTLAVNTAIEYIRSLADRTRTQIAGEMSDVGDADPSWAVDRSNFFNRFGFMTTPGNHVFRSALSAVNPVTTNRVYGRLPGYIPIGDFS